MTILSVHMRRSLAAKSAVVGLNCCASPAFFVGMVRWFPATEGYNSNPKFRQVRVISNYIRDVIRNGSLSPENPLVKALDASKHEESLACFPLIEKYHVQEAIRHVKSKQATIQTHHGEVFSSSNQDGIDNYSALKIIRSVVQAVNDVEEPAHRLRQICGMMAQCRPQSDSSTKQSWASIAASVSNEFRPFQCVTDLPTEKLRSLHSLAYQTQAKVLQAPTNDTELRFAARLLLSKHQTLTGVKDISQDHHEDEADIARYLQFSDALEEVENRLLSTQSMDVSPTLLSDVYNFVGILREQSRLLGYETVMEQALSQSTVATLKEIHLIHDAIEQNIVPEVRVLTGTKSRDEEDLELYLSSTSSSGPKMSAKQIEVKKDEFYAMKLEEYVTLDGALQFLFQLLNRLSGISFRPMGDGVGVFGNKTLVFGAYSEDLFLGTLIIDPFRSSDEAHEAVSIPVFVKSATTTPLVCLSLSVQPPTWDEDPIRVTWDDCESLFHEMGHCLQLLCGKAELGCVLGPELLSGDVSEFLPKCVESFSPEELKNAFKVRSRAKMLKLTEQAFRSSLEIALFSEFDLKGRETMMDLQARLAEKFVPHADVKGCDLEPVISVLRSSIARRQTDQYRYLWSDCASASIFKTLKGSYGANPESALKDFSDDIRRLVLDPGPTADFKELIKNRTEREASDTADLFELYEIR